MRLRFRNGAAGSESNFTILAQTAGAADGLVANMPQSAKSGGHRPAMDVIHAKYSWSGIGNDGKWLPGIESSPAAVRLFNSGVAGI